MNHHGLRLIAGLTLWLVLLALVLVLWSYHV